MTAPLVTELIAADRIAERQRRGSAARLAARARCCRPTAWGRGRQRIVQDVGRLRAGICRDEPALCCA